MDLEDFLRVYDERFGESPSSGASGVAHEQRIGGGIGSAGLGTRIGWSRIGLEEMAQEPHSVREVDGAVVVGVDRVDAAEGASAAD